MWEPILVAVLFLSRAYKWCELRVLRCFPHFCEILVKKSLAQADIIINGSRPCDIQVYDKSVYAEICSLPTVGLGESYMAGKSDCKDIPELVSRIFKAGVDGKLFPQSSLYNYLEMEAFNLQTKSRAFEVAHRHYDLGNDLFKMFLDDNMQYSCGYWKNARNLNEAQLNRMDLTARKLKLEPGMRVLEIGCGWGYLAKYLTSKYNIEMVCCTVSKEGAAHTREVCHGLPVHVYVCDYRDIQKNHPTVEKYDRIVSIEMIEHVGAKNYREYFRIANSFLKDDGIFLLQTSGIAQTNGQSGDLFTHKYIFPNGRLPYMKQIVQNLEGLFIWEDWHTFGYDHYKTIMAWHANFTKGWTKEMAKNYPPTMFKMWEFYLLGTAGAFKARQLQVWQIVLTKHGLSNVYESFR